MHTEFCWRPSIRFIRKHRLDYSIEYRNVKVLYWHLHMNDSNSNRMKTVSWFCSHTSSIQKIFLISMKLNQFDEFKENFFHIHNCLNFSRFNQVLWDSRSSESSVILQSHLDNWSIIFSNFSTDRTEKSRKSSRKQISGPCENWWKHPEYIKW